jgi:hypothetical protein
VIFRHPYLIHTKSNFRKKLVLWIQHFIFFTSIFQIFAWRKKSCLQTLRSSYGVISLWRYPLVEIIFYENQDGIFFLWDLRLWILSIQPSHSYTLAYCRPIHLISIEFQNIDNNQSSPPKKLFLPFNCYDLAIRKVTLTEVFSTTYWHSKVQDLMVGSRKISFHFDHWPTCQ